MWTPDIIFPWCFLMRLLGSIYRFYTKLTRKTKKEKNKMDATLKSANTVVLSKKRINDPDNDDWGQFVTIDNV